MTIALMWFRQDLRCHDNPALALACHNHQAVIPLYIFDDQSHWAMGGAQRWWLQHSLCALQHKLQQQGLQLCLKKGDALAHLQRIIEQYQVEAVYWNRCYEPESIVRDQAIKSALKQHGTQVYSSNGSLFNEPWTVKNNSGNYFKVFTPYWKQSLKQLHIPLPQTITHWPQGVVVPGDNLSDWQLLPHKPNWAKEFSDYWQPGEDGASAKLQQFIDHHLSGYKQQRDFPAQQATSRLSPHLHFGELSPWQVWRAIEQAKQHPHSDLRAADHFLAEMGWREFSYHLLYHFPELPSANFRQEFNAFSWQDDETKLHCWQQGMTGFPIVDAGMRELWRTGYMHNRVRMIVASFLTKDLLINWQKGALWFWDTLVDADLANNSASWQWVAGSGADAAPYFRVFNPVLQGEKFDPNGDYIRQWVPELAAVNAKWIHKPWQAPAGSLGLTLGKEYPLPLVDHDQARQDALSAWQSIRKNSLTNAKKHNKNGT